MPIPFRYRLILGTGAGRKPLAFESYGLIDRIAHQCPAQFDDTVIVIGTAEGN